MPTKKVYADVPYTASVPNYEGPRQSFAERLAEEDFRERVAVGKAAFSEFTGDNRGYYRYRRRQRGFSLASVSKTRKLPPPGSRKACAGWSNNSLRSNRNFLQSIDARSLEGLEGYTYTLTLSRVPDTPKEWSRLINLWFEEMKRRGFVLVHAVTEWQRRRAPHYHALAFRDPAAPSCRWTLDDPIAEGLRIWCRIARDYEALPVAQHGNSLTDLGGWSQYVVKHQSKTMHDVQRSPELIPEQWNGKTPRMWNKRGLWQLAPPVDVTLIAEDARELAARVHEEKAREARKCGNEYAAGICEARASALRNRELGSAKYVNVSGWVEERSLDPKSVDDAKFVYEEAIGETLDLT